MKIAICISGLIREAKACYPNFKKYLLDANPNCEFDIYIHTWIPDRSQLVKPQPKDECSLQEVLNLYKPRDYIVELYNKTMRERHLKECRIEEIREWIKQLDIPRRIDGRWASHVKCEICGKWGKKAEKCRICGGNLTVNVLAMHYSIWKANLISKADNYDLVLRWRFDNYLQAPYLIELVPGNKIEVLAGYDNFPEFGGAINDQAALAHPWVMTYAYANCYQDFYHLARQCVERGWDIFAHSILQTSLENENINITRKDVKYCLFKNKDRK